jgi:hypothetical protein
MIVAHDVVNVGHDRSQLATMAKIARDAIGQKKQESGPFSASQRLRLELKIHKYWPSACH